MTYAIFKDGNQVGEAKEKKSEIIGEADRLGLFKDGDGLLTLKDGYQLEILKEHPAIKEPAPKKVVMEAPVYGDTPRRAQLDLVRKCNRRGFKRVYVEARG